MRYFNDEEQKLISESLKKYSKDTGINLLDSMDGKQIDLTKCCRTIDDLGRVVIPKVIRNELGIQPGDSFNIIVDKNEISVTFKKVRDT